MMEFDAGSFRDPTGRVFYHHGKVYRSLADATSACLPPKDLDGFWPSELVPHPLADSISQSTHAHSDTQQHLAVSQPTLPLVSYPYEWSFEMLRDAALHTLALQLQLLERNLSLKDATAFNITFVGCRPTHFDCYSVEPFKAGGLWPAYGQFCRSFLNPLLIWSHKSIDPRPWLQAGLGEINAQDTLKLLGKSTLLKAGVFKDVYLPHKLEQLVSNKKATAVESLGTVQIPRDRLTGMLHRMEKLIRSLPQPQASLAWEDYIRTCTYADDETKQKEAFVSQALNTFQPQRVLDIGCNTGHYSRLAARIASRVIACDLDSACIDSLYERAKSDTSLKDHLTPLVMDITRPAPALGWRLQERKDALTRLRSDAFLALAVVHHLRISGGIPVGEILDALATLAPAGVLEWVGPEDVMVKELNAFRKLDLADLRWENFKAEVEKRFEIRSTEIIKEGQRLLLSVTKPSH